MVIREIECKSILNESEIADYCLNPYVGCEHACIYCYAEYLTRKFYGEKGEWGTFVEVKVNAPHVLRRSILKKRKGTVFISSLTDAYQPIEKKYEITRECLEVLGRYKFIPLIQTKSSLVARDVDLLKKSNAEVGFTVTTIEEDLRKIFEPRSSSVEEKLSTIQFLIENGIRVYVFLGPFLPCVSDRNLEEYFSTMREIGVEEIWVDKLNLKPNTLERMGKVLSRKDPELFDQIKQKLFDKSYYERVRKDVEKLGRKYGLRTRFCF